MENRLTQLDAHIDVVTPENIAFHYEVAGPFRRLPAYLIDLAIRTATLLVVWVATTLAFGFEIGVGFSLILFFALDFFYGGLFETLWNGQTPGKRLLHLRVLTVDGQPINASQAVLRNLFRLADAMPTGCYLIGLVTMSANRRFQRLGDLVAGTMVVIEHIGWLEGVTRVDEPRAVQLAEYLPRKFEVSREMGRALSAYVERRRYFSKGRRADIARYVGAPLVARFGLPSDTSHDLLLCALYHRAFFADDHKADKPPVQSERISEKNPNFTAPPTETEFSQLTLRR